MSDCPKCDEGVPVELVYDADACKVCGFGSEAHASPCAAFNALTMVREENARLRRNLAEAEEDLRREVAAAEFLREQQR